MKIDALKLRILLGEYDLKIKDLAELSGVSRQTISYILSGKRCTPQVMYKITSALGVEMCELMGKEELDG